MNNSRSTLIITLVVGGLIALCLGGSVGALGMVALTGRLPRAEQVALPQVRQAPTKGAENGEESFVLGTDLSGHEWTLAELDGRPYVLNFWATWCPPCREELPQMQQLAGEFAEHGVVVLLVNDGETVNQARDYLHYHDLDLPCIPDPSSRLARHYRVRGLPTTIMVGADGEIEARLMGYSGAEHLRRAFEALVD